MYRSFLLFFATFVTFLCFPGFALAEIWDDSDFPINPGLWPTLHHDMHNSDHMAANIGDFSSLVGLSEKAWVLRETGHPSVVLTVEAIGSYAGREMCFITTGKTAQPNLNAFDLADGSKLWHAAASTAADPGPGACAMSSMALLDENGKLFISDCRYLFCYDVLAAPDAAGAMPYLWRRPLPGLRQYNESDGLWYAATDPSQPFTRAKPFVTLFFTRKVAGKSYLGGISTEGGIYIFDPDNGALFAQGWLEIAAAAEARDWTPEGRCDVADYVLRDDPMYYDISPDAEDGLTPFGIWTTGVRPETNDPDGDYFMDPCQLSGYFSANTAGGGGMVINTPAVALDPLNPYISRIYVNGSQSDFLAELDNTPAAEDAILYRIDFDPTALTANRLTVQNHRRRQGTNRPAYGGRMPNGENSLSSPTLCHNEKWIITADNQGKLYNFSAEDGSLIWMEDIGSLLGSPTVVQRTESDGRVYIHTFGDSRLWTLACDPETGAVMEKKVVDFRPYIIRNYWRGDDSRYDRHFVNQNGKRYERAAVGASIAVATNDKMVLVYTVGWHDPDRPAPFLIPSHSVILIVDRLSLLKGLPTESMVNSACIDTHGTMEQATLIAPADAGLRLLIPYGSQSTTFARFLEVNGKMPEDMKVLYVKPFGGVRIVEPQFTSVPVLAPDLPSGQSVGTPVRWRAAFPGNPVADYRFSVGRAGGEMRILKDFNPSPVFVWTPMAAGDYTVRVSARNRSDLSDIASTDATFQVRLPIPDGSRAAVTVTNHPLVAIYSHNNCPAGARMRVDYRPSGSDSAQWSRTGYVPCMASASGSAVGSAAIHVAGMKAGLAYELRPAWVSRGVETTGTTDDTLFFTPQSPGLSFPDTRALMSGGGNTDEPMIFMAGFPQSPSNPLPLATDLSGEVVWFYNRFQDESVVATRSTPEGGFLLITVDEGIPGQRLREVDLAGNVIREVTISRINEQLAAMGQDMAGAFNHEAVRFPNGQTLAQVSVERLMPGVQSDADTILGAMIVALDRNWQVVWVWNAFDHLDVTRSSVSGEVCVSTGELRFPGCPPLFSASRAADWIHGNHIAPSPLDGHLIYSMRNQDWVIKIDYADGTGSGKVLWKLGAEGDFMLTSASGVADTQPWFSHQHGAAYVSENHIIVCDNGNTRCTEAE